MLIDLIGAQVNFRSYCASLKSTIMENARFQKYLQELTKSVHWHINEGEERSFAPICVNHLTEYSVQVSAVNSDGEALVELFCDQRDSTLSECLYQTMLTSEQYPALYTINDSDERYTGDYESFFDWFMTSHQTEVNGELCSMKQLVATHAIMRELHDELRPLFMVDVKNGKI